MFALLVVGCAAEVRYVPLLPAPRQLYVRGPAQVELFMVTPPLRPHLDIGMLSLAWADSESQTVQQMIDRVRAAAGQHGCDAFLVTRAIARPEGIARPKGVSRLSSIEGSCEVYTDVPPTTASTHP
jgi:hypothetical protein